MDDQSLKACTKCFEFKPMTAFHKKTSAKDGHFPWCKSCVYAYAAAKNAAGRAARMLGA